MSLDVAARVVALRRCALFAAADDESLNRLAKATHVRRYRRGEIVFHADDPAAAMHHVVAGRFRVTLVSADGREAVVAELGPGDSFGELALLDRAPRSATVLAVEPGQTLLLDRETVRQALAVDAAFRDALLVALAATIRRLTHQVEELHFLDLGGRLASLILARLDPNTTASPPIRVPWPYSQAEVAGMIGGTRQSVNRLLADLEDAELLQVAPGELVILNLARLRQLADR